MATETLTITIRVHRGRLNSLGQQALAELKRARRRDRPALQHRWVKRMSEECLVPLL